MPSSICLDHQQQLWLHTLHLIAVSRSRSRHAHWPILLWFNREVAGVVSSSQEEHALLLTREHDCYWHLASSSARHWGGDLHTKAWKGRWRPRGKFPHTQEGQSNGAQQKALASCARQEADHVTYCYFPKSSCLFCPLPRPSRLLPGLPDPFRPLPGLSLASAHLPDLPLVSHWLPLTSTASHPLLRLPTTSACFCSAPQSNGPKFPWSASAQKACHCPIVPQHIIPCLSLSSLSYLVPIVVAYYCLSITIYSLL